MTTVGAAGFPDCSLGSRPCAYTSLTFQSDLINTLIVGFPGGVVVENPPTNAGDTGSSPGPGGSHMPQSNKALVPQLLSLHSRAHGPQLLKPVRLEPVLRNKRNPHNVKPAHHNEQ